MLPMQTFERSSDEPFLKKQKIEPVFNIGNYPRDLITQIIYQVIKEQNKHVLVKYETEGDNCFEFSDFFNCRLVSKAWDQCAETAAIYFANLRNEKGGRFNFLRTICQKIKCGEGGSWEGEDNSDKYHDLLKRRGHEILSYEEEFFSNGYGGYELQFLPNVRWIRGVEGSVEHVIDYKTVDSILLEIDDMDVLDNFTNLQHLNVYTFGGEIGDCINKIEAFSCKLNSIKTLYLDLEDVGQSAVNPWLFNLWAENLPALQSFTLLTRNEGTLSLGGIYPVLEKLKLSSSVRFDFEASIVCLPNLTHLRVSQIGPVDLFKISKSFPHMKYLNLKTAAVSREAIAFFALNRTQAMEIKVPNKFNEFYEFEEWKQLLNKSHPFIEFIK